jgi:hypothetical protein
MKRNAGQRFFKPLDRHSSDISLTAEPIAEIERRLAEDEPFAADAEVRATFDRITRNSA